MQGVREQTPVVRRTPRRPDSAVTPVATPVVAAPAVAAPAVASPPIAATAAAVTAPVHRDEPLRRTLHFSVALVGLVISTPVMAVVALLVRLTSRGPVIYSQTRVGLDRRGNGPDQVNHRRQQDLGGKPFRIYKFRTMTTNAETGSGAVWAQANDPRVTWIGRYLRQYRLDELPQLYNVVRGEMNIVGPRPERPTIFAQLREHIGEYPLRQRAKPGITGLAQINHHYDRCIDDVKTKVSYDLRYIQRQGIIEDLKIMLQTVPVMLFRRGGW